MSKYDSWGYQVCHARASTDLFFGVSFVLARLLFSAVLFLCFVSLLPPLFPLFAEFFRDLGRRVGGVRIDTVFWFICKFPRVRGVLLTAGPLTTTVLSVSGGAHGEENTLPSG